jgi:hypothetical protein
LLTVLSLCLAFFFATSHQAAYSYPFFFISIVSAFLWIVHVIDDFYYKKHAQETISNTPISSHHRYIAEASHSKRKENDEETGLLLSKRNGAIAQSYGGHSQES